MSARRSGIVLNENIPSAARRSILRSPYADVPACTEYQRDYQPTAAHRTVYDASFEEFVNIYRQNKAIYRRLNAGRRRS